MFFRHLIALVFASFFALTTVHAAEYYVVVPMKGKKANSGPPPLEIDESASPQLYLDSGNVPKVIPGVPYSVDLKQYLYSMADGSFNANSASLEWFGDTSALELTVTPDGRLQGTAPPEFQAGQPFRIMVAVIYEGRVHPLDFEIRTWPLSMYLFEQPLPVATAGQAYSVDFKQMLLVSDENFQATSQTFRLNSVPAAGISLSSSEPGVLNVSSSVPPGVYKIPLTASYYHQSVSFEYTLTVQAP